MARYERVAEIYALLTTTREPMALGSLCSSLHASPATVKRTIRFLRETLGAPVRFDRDAGGYVLDRGGAIGTPLTGPQYGSRELVSMLTAYELLAQIPPGVFRRETAVARAQLESLLYRKPTGARELRRRVRLLLPQVREMRDDAFRTVLAALNAQRRLKIVYHGRSRDTESERIVSPLRLTFYRSNWYLAAWCQKSGDLRVFSLDRIAYAEQTPLPNAAIDEAHVEARLSTAYGIFEGQADRSARLRFTPRLARWVADETWHPQQVAELQPDGSLVLLVPYRHATELVMDVLRYGADVEVLAPAELRREVADALRSAAALYGA